MMSRKSIVTRLNSGTKAPQRIRHSFEILLLAKFSIRTHSLQGSANHHTIVSDLDHANSTYLLVPDIMEAASARYAARDRFGGFGEPAQTPLQRYIRRSLIMIVEDRATADTFLQKMP